MPVMLVGTAASGKANFMTAAWVVRLEFNPPLLMLSIGNESLSAENIIQNKTFSVCQPDVSMKDPTDYCGITSGKKVDKSTLFETFSGALENAPLIAACPVNLECRLVHTYEFPGTYLFIGEIVGAFGRNDVLDKGKPVIEKTNPLVLSMPDNRYWSMNTVVGRAWKDGISLKKQSKKGG